ERFGSPASLALTEWNLWSEARSPRHGYAEPGDAAHVIYTALTLNWLIRLGERVELANHYSLANWFGAIRAAGPVAEATAVADVLRWYGQALPAVVRSADCVPDCEQLDAVFLDHPDGPCMILVNSSARTPIRVALPTELGEELDMQTISAPDPLSTAKEE